MPFISLIIQRGSRERKEQPNGKMKIYIFPELIFCILVLLLRCLTFPRVSLAKDMNNSELLSTMRGLRRRMSLVVFSTW